MAEEVEVEDIGLENQQLPECTESHFLNFAGNSETALAALPAVLKIESEAITVAFSASSFTLPNASD